eukprot:TRINITY_DN9552_c0_g1_i1.p1 TRINITY_DN9552_c0_g1~~TRINITY_DN9552_c0_g1_i1.p1  ORF type:complete len:266 (+),score=45.99 TRINITY_DN9552_c0_g1_i1:1-798(+)
MLLAVLIRTCIRPRLTSFSTMAAQASSLTPAQEITNNLSAVRKSIEDLKTTADLKHEPRLVAVSKTKPIEAIKLAYEAGQRHFGENYIQELVTKSEELSSLSDIRWHFIGHLQSNKAKMLAQVKNLYMMETIDSQKIATTINRMWESVEGEPLRVMLQVNTSGEGSKSGVEPKDAVPLASLIASSCPRLHLAGLMTIGSPNPTPDQPDFTCLKECRGQVSRALGVSEESLELSMGMSGDYQEAIRHGSTNVRVGSLIFGARDYSK